MGDKKNSKVKIRRWQPEDIQQIVHVQRSAYPNFGDEDLCDEGCGFMDKLDMNSALICFRCDHEF